MRDDATKMREKGVVSNENRVSARDVTLRWLFNINVDGLVKEVRAKLLMEDGATL